jgi:diguanylate cyclase (GGDEF)-like protein
MALGVLLIVLLAACAALVAAAAAAWQRRRADRLERERRALHDAFTRVLGNARTESEALAVLDGYLRRDTPGVRFVFQRVDEAGEPDCVSLRDGDPHAEVDAATLARCDRCREDGSSFCVPAVARGRRVGVLRASGRTPTPEERERIAAAVRFAAPALASMRDVSTLDERALADELTGLPNRRATSDHLERMVAEATRSDTHLSFLVVDLDHFAHLNEEQGLAAGDAALTAIAGALRETVRSSDVVGRIGGEEFALLLHDTDTNGAAIVAANVLQAVRDLGLDGVDGPLTASVGIATYPQDAPDGRELYNAADHALSLAKADGRDRAVAF